MSGSPMSDSTMRANADALARDWADVATRARARHVRRLLVTLALMLVMVAGLFQFGNILLWVVRTTTWWALVPAGLHALGILLAIGLPAFSGASLSVVPSGFKRQMADRFGDRFARLRALRTVVTAEAAMLFAWPLLRYVATGEQIRWGVTFTVAICSLAILWPLQRIANAQRAESRRLLGVDDSDTR